MIDQNNRQLEFVFEFAEAKPKQLLGLLTPDDIYANADTLLERLKEDRRIERKSAKEHAEPLGECFAMWANTSPDGGLIVFGMSDDGKTFGCEALDTKNINRIENAGADFAPGCQYG